MTVVDLCELVDPGRSVGRSVGRFSHLGRRAYFIGTVQIKNSHSFVTHRGLDRDCGW